MAQGKGGGRPVRRKDAPLTKTQTFRLSASLDEQLRTAAEKSGRSISEEIQFRLEQTFMPNTPFTTRADYEAVSSTYQFMLAMGDIVRKDHPGLDPLFQQMLANWQSIKGEK